jgi:hypothetical protein
MTLTTPSREALPVLKEQRVLLELLVEERFSNETKLARALSATQTESAPPAPAYKGDSITAAHVREATTEKREFTFLGPEVERELLGHCLLVDRMLCEAEEPRYNLSPRLTSKVQEGVLGVHWVEWSHLSRIHGHENLLKLVGKNKAVVSGITSPNNWVLRVCRLLICRKHAYWTSCHDYHMLPRFGPIMSQPVQLQPTNPPTDQNPPMYQPDLGTNFRGSFDADQNFNLDFSTLENSDVLKDYDFDSFLNTATDDAFNFDDGIGLAGEIGTPEKRASPNAVSKEIHALLSQFGGFSEVDLPKLLSETGVDEPCKSRSGSGLAVDERSSEISEKPSTV